MEQTARVPNPVTGRVDDGTHVRPVTQWMVVGRYLLALLIPLWVLVWTGLPDVAGHWWVLLAWVVVLYLVSALAHGSWWSSSAWAPGWTSAMIAQVAVLVVGTVVSIGTGESLVMMFTATLLIGAVLGAAALQGWAELRARRHRR